MSAPREGGFSTVELLISLFIAAAFITTGFRLFSVVIEDGNKARLRSRAANIAAETLKHHRATAPVPCPASSTAHALTIPTSELPMASGEVTFSCPYGVGARTTRINVAIQYDAKPETLQAGLDVTR